MGASLTTFDTHMHSTPHRASLTTFGTHMHSTPHRAPLTTFDTHMHSTPHRASLTTFDTHTHSTPHRASLATFGCTAWRRAWAACSPDSCSGSPRTPKKLGKEDHQAKYFFGKLR